MRFTAPPHTSSVDLSIGPVSVVDGMLDTQDAELTQGDLTGLRAHGFVLDDPQIGAEQDAEATTASAGSRRGRRSGQAEEQPVVTADTTTTTNDA